VALDLKNPAGLNAFYDLVRASDGVIYGFAPDVPKRLGIDFYTLRGINPRIRVVQLIGLHDSDGYERAPAYDLIVQALGGVMSITGDADGPPARVGYQIADLAGGMYLALALCAALATEPASADDSYVQVSLLDCQLALLTWHAQNYFVSGTVSKPSGSRGLMTAPSEAFQAADDRYVAVSPTGEKFWLCFCEKIGRPELAEDPRFSTRADRLANVEALAEILGKTFSTAAARDWVKLFNDARVPAAEVLRVDEALEQPVAEARAMTESVAHPESGTSMRFLGNPFKYGSAESLSYPPKLGGDTGPVLRQVCSYSDDKIAELSGDRAIYLGGEL
jgi:formyl-CoA transferase